MSWGDFAAAFGGATASGAANISGMMLGFQHAKELQRRANEFSERMARNRYRYSVEDMRAAGLNPLLMAQAGPGAAPSGAVAGTPGNQLAGLGAAAKEVGEKAIQLRLMRKQAAKVDADTANVTQEAWLKNAQTHESNERFNLLKEQQNAVKAQTEQTKLATQLGATEIPAASAKAAMDMTKFGESMRYFHRFMQSLWGTNVSGAFKPGRK